MSVDHVDVDGAAAGIAAAIGEPARARMLYTLMDDRARTSTELALIADVSPSTASAHLSRLKARGLVEVRVQGKHRYYRLAGATVAAALEQLSVLAGDSRGPFKSTAPSRLRAARTCYDHLAGSLGVALHDRLATLGWLTSATPEGPDVYDLTPAGAAALEALGIDIDAVRALRRRFAFGCLDWSERRAHLGGGLGAALLRVAVQRKWVERERDSRALRVTELGRHQMRARLGIDVGSATGMRV
ncbi:MAG TPA: helix-turn-helix domain-containing protein [Gemmatimonadaceae bacterium]